MRLMSFSPSQASLEPNLARSHHYRSRQGENTRLQEIFGSWLKVLPLVLDEQGTMTMANCFYNNHQVNRTVSTWP